MERLKGFFRVLLLAPVLFSAGLMVSGITCIPDGATGVRKALWSDTRISVLGPGVHIYFPLTHRIKTFDLSGNIKLGNYFLGNFREMKAIEGLTTDGYKVTLHLTATWAVTPKTAEALLKRFDGELPEPYFEYHIRETIRRMIPRANRRSFEGTAVNQFLKAAENQSKTVLSTKGFPLESIELQIMDDHSPDIVEATDWDREKWSMLY